MTFTKPGFALLVIIAYLVWRLLGDREREKLWSAAIASVTFYALVRWQHLGVLLACAAWNWWIALRMVRGTQAGATYAIGVVGNLLLLAIFKYTPLMVQTARDLGIADLPEPPAGALLPLGLSFFVFTGIAYLTSVRRGLAVAETEPLRFLVYMTFFPHLAAGPILRADEFLVHLRPGALPTPTHIPSGALLLIGRGYLKKMVLADRIAAAIDPYFAHAGTDAVAGAWALPLLCLYSLQIYFDFSGYTDIARGLARLFGFDWPENFHLPYLARSIREFWGRWHITLSRFLRDHIYIPLGGNRHGRLRTAAALAVTMLLGGLWHGASWSFLVWGAIHGTMLIAHRAFGNGRTGMSVPLNNQDGSVGRTFLSVRLLGRAISVAATFLAVTLAWAFFRITDVSRAWACVVACWDFNPDTAFAGAAGDASLLVALVGYAPVSMVIRRLGTEPADESGSAFVDGLRRGLGVGLLLTAMLLAPAEQSPPFLYFRF